MRRVGAQDALGLALLLVGELADGPAGPSVVGVGMGGIGFAVLRPVAERGEDLGDLAFREILEWVGRVPA
jgi:hypothetical protein